MDRLVHIYLMGGNQLLIQSGSLADAHHCIPWDISNCKCLEKFIIN